jgi:FkbM family methyltransferase
MQGSMLKRGLFRMVGGRKYRLLHGAFFLMRLLLALAWKPYGRRFFGADMLALSQRIRPGDTVLDIGAYLGGTAVLFALKAGPTGLILAFEPYHHRFLGLLVRLLRLRVRVLPVALSSAGGRADLVVPVHAGVPVYSQAGFAGSYDTETLGRSGAYSFQRAEVRTARLDDVLEEEGIDPGAVSAVKIDVEGAELAVLEGGARFLDGFRGPLVCEFWFEPMPPKGWAWLRDRGWDCLKLDASGRGFREAGTPPALAELARGETYGNFWWTRGGPGPGPVAAG